MNDSLNLEKISAHADGGPRSRVCARETLCSAPHRRDRKFSGTRVCRVAFKHFPNPQKSYPKFQNSTTSLHRIYLKLADFPVKIGFIGGKGVPRNCFLIGIFKFVLLGSPSKNLEPYDKHCWNIFEDSPFSGQNGDNWGSLKFAFHWNPPHFVT